MLRPLHRICASAIALGLLAVTPAYASSVRVPPDFYGINFQRLSTFGLAARNTHSTSITSLGIGQVRLNASCAAIEPRAPIGGIHTYRWGALDQAIGTLARHGIHAQPTLTQPPNWDAVQGTWVQLQCAKAASRSPVDVRPYGGVAPPSGKNAKNHKQYLGIAEFFGGATARQPSLAKTADGADVHIYPGVDVQKQLAKLAWFRSQLHDGRIPDRVPMVINEVGWPTHVGKPLSESDRATAYALMTIDYARTNCNVGGILPTPGPARSRARATRKIGTASPTQDRSAVRLDPGILAGTAPDARPAAAGGAKADAYDVPGHAAPRFRP